jgi:hypothetical protein
MAALGTARLQKEGDSSIEMRNKVCHHAFGVIIVC